MDQEPVSGLTLIEKLDTQAAKASYAVILMTGDDVGREKGQPVEWDRPRARQNVVLELGMFLGRFGRNHVAILHESGVELPSDIAGLEYIGGGRDDDDRAPHGRAAGAVSQGLHAREKFQKKHRPELGRQGPARAG